MQHVCNYIQQRLNPDELQLRRHSVHEIRRPNCNERLWNPYLTKTPLLLSTVEKKGHVMSGETMFCLSGDPVTAFIAARARGRLWKSNGAVIKAPRIVELTRCGFQLKPFEPHQPESFSFPRLIWRAKMRMLPIHNLSPMCECKMVAQITVSENQ